MNLAVLFIIAFTVISLAFLNWQLSTKLVLVILIMEGAIRKWLLPQMSDIIYFLKDFVLLGAYLRYFIFPASQEKFTIKRNSTFILILIVAGWILFQSLNPSLGSPIIGMLGIRAYLLYIPLIWLVPNLFQSELELHRFLRNYLLLVFPVCILGVAQFFSPPDSPINVYVPVVGEAADITTFGTEVAHARVTGTFSYIAGHSAYLAVCYSLLLVLLVREKTYLWRWIYAFETLLVIVNSFMTGSRGAVFFIAIFSVIFFGTKILKQPGELFKDIGKIFIPTAAILIAAMLWFQPAINAFVDRANTSDSNSERIIDSFTQVGSYSQYSQYKGLDGYGAGATHQAASIVRHLFNLPPGEEIPPNEGETGRVYLELGPFGFILWYGLRLTFIAGLGSLFLQLKRPFLKDLALAACLTQLILISSPLVFHHTFLPHFWFLSSFIFLLPRLEQREKFVAKIARIIRS